jgi:hypothetical protein
MKVAPSTLVHTSWLVILETRAYSYCETPLEWGVGAIGLSTVREGRQYSRWGWRQGRRLFELALTFSLVGWWGVGHEKRKVITRNKLVLYVMGDSAHTQDLRHRTSRAVLRLHYDTNNTYLLQRHRCFQSLEAYCRQLFQLQSRGENALSDHHID